MWELAGMDLSMEYDGAVTTDMHLKMYGDGVMTFEEVREALGVGYFPVNKPIVTCSYCGQWGAKKTACRHCGGTINA